MGKLYDSLPDDLGMPPEWWAEHWKTHPRVEFIVYGPSHVGEELAPDFLGVADEKNDLRECGDE